MVRVILEYLHFKILSLIQRNYARQYISIFAIAFFLLFTAESITSQTISDFWQQTNGPYGGNINALAINSLGYVFSITDDGLYYTTDNGDNWIKAGLKTNFTVRVLAINSSDHIFAGSSYDNNMYRSTDNGISWKQINTGIKDRYINALTISSIGYIFAGTDSGAYRSTDNGESWTKTGLEKNISVKALAINSHSDIFAGTYNHGVYRSTDNGDSWFSTGLMTNISVNALVINSSDHIFAGSSYNYGVFRSIDNGNAWAQINKGLLNTNVYALTMNASGQIFAGTDSSLFRSSDNGASWVQTDSLKDISIRSLVTNNIGLIYAGTYYNGLFQCNEKLKNWIQMKLQYSEISSIAINPSGHLFAGAYRGIYRSFDNGSTWTFLKNCYASKLAINNETGCIFAYSSYSIYRSTDNGTNWEKISNPYSTYSLTIDQGGIVLIGSYGGRIFRSIDNGNSWKQTDTGLKSTDINTFATNSIGYIFAGTDSGAIRSTDHGISWTQTGLETNISVVSLAINSKDDIFAGTYNHGIYRSTDNGNTWIPTGLMTNFGVNSLAINSNGYIFASTSYNYGVFRSTDNGEAWAQINTGLSDVRVNSLAINPSGNIYAGTRLGVFRSVKSTTSSRDFINKIPQLYSLSQNYPNPFNTSTTIEFSLAKSGFVTLQVFNTLGERMETLISERLGAGIYLTKWDATHYSSGVYFYQLNTELNTETKKLILLK